MPPKNVVAEQKAEEQETYTVVITDGDKTYRLNTDSLGPADDLIARQQTGFPVSQFIQTGGNDSLVAMIWMARRKAGEPNLAFQQVLKHYPTNSSLNALEVKFEDSKGEEIDPLAASG